MVVLWKEYLIGYRIRYSVNVGKSDKSIGTNIDKPKC